MSELLQKRCVACNAQTPRLAAAEITGLLSALPGYRADAGFTSISKVYELDDFYETMAFVNAVAFIAHREDHHPDLVVSYKRCTVTYSTHAVGGLTENDFICATKTEALVGR